MERRAALERNIQLLRMTVSVVQSLIDERKQSKDQTTYADTITLHIAGLLINSRLEKELRSLRDHTDAPPMKIEPAEFIRNEPIFVPEMRAHPEAVHDSMFYKMLWGGQSKDTQKDPRSIRK